MLEFKGAFWKMWKDKLGEVSFNEASEKCAKGVGCYVVGNGKPLRCFK